MGRVFSYSLVASGVLSLLFGLVPLFADTQSTLINIYPTDAGCYGVPALSPYNWSCEPNYDRLRSPFDVLPLLSILYFMVGGVTFWSAFAQRFRHKILLLSLSTGLIATGLTSYVGGLGDQGWPIVWVLYPISHPPSSSYFPVYILVPAFLADWIIFSVSIGIILVWILPSLSKSLRQK